MALSLLAGSAQAQHAARDSALATQVQQETDSIKRDKSRPQYIERSRLRLLKIADSLRNGKPDTLRLTRVDTVYITKDTATPPPPPQIKLIVAIHANAISLNVGSTLQLISDVRDSAGNVVQKPVAWSVTEGSAFGSVSNTGLLTGISGGMVTVRAAVDTFWTSRQFTVLGSAPPTDTSSTSKDTTVVVTPGGGGATLTHPFAPPSNGAIFAELPRTQVDVSYPSTTSTIRVAAGGDLQAALDGAAAGTTILLAPGSVFSGNFNLGKNNCPAWTIIRTDLTDAQIGAVGTRMDPTRATTLKLARINGMFGQGGLGTTQGTNVGCYRIVGVELAQAANQYDANGLISMRYGSHDIIVDRSYLHGEDNVPVRRCVVLNGTKEAIIDSWLTDCNSLTGDAQSILGYEGNGPFLIKNNHIEGGSEVIMWGGATGAPNTVPCDIIVEDNDITRDPRDKTANVATIKNLIESKNSCRSLYQRNRIHNNWSGGQVGFGILLKSVDQSSSGCTWCRTTDVTIRNNYFYNSGNGFNLANIQEGQALPAARYSIYNNVIDSLNVGIYTSQGMPFQLLGGTPDIIIMNNVLKGPTNLWGLVQWDGGVPNPRLVFTNNILWCGGYGLKASGMSSGTNSWNGYTQNGLWQDNAMWGTSCSSFPTGSTFINSWTDADPKKYGPLQ